MVVMEKVEMEALLSGALIGRLGMADGGGKPYVIPMPFCWYDEAIYLRLPMTGRKAAVLLQNNRVCFEVDWFDETLRDYGSVLVEGRLAMVEDLCEKAAVKAINDEKYTRLRKGIRPGHGRSTPLEALPMCKILSQAISGRRKESPQPAAVAMGHGKVPAKPGVSGSHRAYLHRAGK